MGVGFYLPVSERHQSIAGKKEQLHVCVMTCVLFLSAVCAHGWMFQIRVCVCVCLEVLQPTPCVCVCVCVCVCLECLQPTPCELPLCFRVMSPIAGCSQRHKDSPNRQEEDQK